MRLHSHVHGYFLQNFFQVSFEKYARPHKNSKHYQEHAKATGCDITQSDVNKEYEAMSERISNVHPGRSFSYLRFQ